MSGRRIHVLNRMGSLPDEGVYKSDHVAERALAPSWRCASAAFTSPAPASLVYWHESGLAGVLQNLAVAASLFG